MLAALKNVMLGRPSWATRLPIMNSNKFTPDIAQLEQKEFHLLFLYGDTLGWHKNNEIVQADNPPMIAYTENKYVLWKKRLGKESFAVILRDDQKTRIEGTLVSKEIGFCRTRYRHVKSAVKKAPVRGELYIVRPQEFLKLDEYHLNGVHFRRKLTTVAIPYRQTYKEHGKVVGSSEFVTRVECWTYFGRSTMHPITEENSPYVPVKTFEPNSRDAWLREYYYFSPDELNEF